MIVRAYRVGFVLLSILLAASAAAQDAAPEEASTAAGAPAAPAEPPPAAEPPVVPAATAAPPEAEPGSVQLLSEEELTALGLDAAGPSVDLSFKLSGFADAGFAAFLGPEDAFWRASGTVPARPTFFVGNVNVYLQKNLTETLSSMVEIRFSYLPNGSGSFGFAEREDTSTSDYTDFGRTTRWGTVILQRVYAQWMPHTLFGLRVGQFLTPYGVWNVDHGSPVIIPIRKPWIIGVGWIPEKQTGLEFLGRASLSADNALGYHLTLSNGVGPISEYADLDNNKAFGARLYWENRSLGRLRIGASGYYGRVTDASFDLELMGTSPKANEVIAEQYDTLSWAGDLTWDIGDLHLQTEWIANQKAYTEEGRKPQISFGRSVIPSDVFSWGGYGLIGYRLPWFGVMPFFLVERVVGDLYNAEVKQTVYQVGFNIRPVDEFVIKLQFDYVDQDRDGLDSIKLIATQVAWAF